MGLSVCSYSSYFVSKIRKKNLSRRTLNFQTIPQSSTRAVIIENEHIYSALLFSRTCQINVLRWTNFIVMNFMLSSTLGVFTVHSVVRPTTFGHAFPFEAIKVGAQIINKV